MKAKALQIISEATRDRGWVPEYARGTAELWTPKLVREALIDAHRMLKRIGGKVGPGPLKAWWPTFQNNPEDYADEEKQRRKAEQKSDQYHTRMTPTRMELVLLGKDGEPPWLDGPLLLAPELRRVLLTWIKAELRGEAFKELCRRKVWTYTTALTHRDRAAGMIAQRLNAAKVPVW